MKASAYKLSRPTKRYPWEVRRQLVKIEEVLALRAPQGVAAGLKGAAAVIVVAARAQKVALINRAILKLQRAYNATRWRWVAYVAVKLSMHVLHTGKLVLEFQRGQLQVGILRLRLLNCRGKLGHGGFDLSVARFLRSVQHVMNSPESVGDNLYRAPNVGGALGRHLNDIEKATHEYLRMQRSAAAAWGAALIEASRIAGGR